jgi:hypothetical protein
MMRQVQFRMVADVAAILVGLTVGIAPVLAEEVKSTSARQFSTISTLTGEWRVKERSSLKIVFERTAGGSVIVEKWMSGEQTHSLTIYHLHGEKLIATHYCPQGNQPRLAAVNSDSGEIRFTFQDATDLDPNESYQHDLSLELNSDGTLSRGEIYWGPNGAGEKSTLTLVRAAI